MVAIIDRPTAEEQVFTREVLRSDHKNIPLAELWGQSQRPQNDLELERRVEEFGYRIEREARR